MVAKDKKAELKLNGSLEDLDESSVFGGLLSALVETAEFTGKEVSDCL